jgi:hypothetical protein
MELARALTSRDAALRDLSAALETARAETAAVRASAAQTLNDERSTHAAQVATLASHRSTRQRASLAPPSPNPTSGSSATVTKRRVVRVRVCVYVRETQIAQRGQRQSTSASADGSDEHKPLSSKERTGSNSPMVTGAQRPCARAV